MTATVAPPPGQLELFPQQPRPSSTSWRVVFLAGGSEACPAGTPRWSDPVRDLPVAAGRAHTAATVHGEAWLVAADFTSCHVTAAGDVTPSTGWALLAARVIHQRKACSP